MTVVLKGRDACVTTETVLFSRSIQACMEVPEMNVKQYGVRTEMEEKARCDRREAHEQDFSFSGLLVKLVNTLKSVEHPRQVNCTLGSTFSLGIQLPTIWF